MSVIQVNAGVNPAMRREYDFKSFNAIRTVSRTQSIYGRGKFVSTSYKISLVKSDHYKVVMEVWDKDDIDLFEIRKSGGVLELVTDVKKYPYRSSNISAPCATVTIYTPDFPSVTLNGTSRMSGSFPVAYCTVCPCSGRYCEVEHPHRSMISDIPRLPLYSWAGRRAQSASGEGCHLRLH